MDIVTFMRALAPTDVVARIAALSGVHVSTVWRALADDRRISEATRLRVHQEAARLRYRPNRIARQLATGKSRMIGLVTPPPTSESHQKKINSLFDKDHAAGYDLLLRTATHDVEAERAAIAYLRSRRAEGLLLVTQAGAETNAHLRELEAEKVPFVLFDNTSDLATLRQTSVRLDRFACVQKSKK